MEIRQLEYFKEIADTGSINEAARRLNMSQPPLSSQLRRLEDELNVRLFERTKKGVSLTEAGKLLYTHAERILDYTANPAPWPDAHDRHRSDAGDHPFFKAASQNPL